ncbi:MAG: hypothetical protein KDN22_33650 [Verrucomicrobiae bacterium]|nr:hypothetical protein [Verrucomicrobiae bacterium]
MNTRVRYASLGIYTILLHGWAIALVLHLSDASDALLTAIMPGVSWLCLIWTAAPHSEAVRLFTASVAFWIISIAIVLVANQLKKSTSS